MKDEEEELQSRLLVIFKEEARDHLREFSKGLFDLEKKPDPGSFAEISKSIFRSIHSLKGAARAVNLCEVEQLCGSLEDVLDLLRKCAIKPSGVFFETLFQTAEVLEKIIFNEENGSLTILKGTASELSLKLERLIKEKEGCQTGDKLQEACDIQAAFPKASDDCPASVREGATMERAQHPSSAPLIDTIRISSGKIDRLLQHVEEMLMIKLTSKDKVKELESLYMLLEEFGKWSTQHEVENKVFRLLRSGSAKREPDPSLQGLLNELSSHFEKRREFFKQVFEKVANLKRLAEQDLRMTAGLVDCVIDDTKEILMQPFSMVLEGLPKMAREISKSLGKEVVVEVIGDEIEVDRRILEQLKDPLIHILRNSLDHGIESPEARLQKGKDPKGKITISARQMNGNAFEVRLADDGQGIDFARVMEKGIEEGLISPNAKEALSKEQLTRLIFMPGFSTKAIATDISGRGVGLNVLSENVEKLGGSIRVGSEREEGAEFIISLPLTLSTFRGIHVKVSEQEFIIPTHHVVRVFRGQEKEIRTVQGQKIIHLEGKNYSYAELSDILGVPSAKEKAGPDALKPRLLIKAGETEIAFGVDAVYNEQEVFVKGLGKQLKRVKNISASTIMEWGRVIPILDPFDLVKSAASGALSEVRHPSKVQQEGPRKKSILVVEDSITSRMLLKNILESAGYSVKTAVDGFEGYGILTKGRFDLVLSDVEMPRLNGFELTRKIRSSEKLSELPVILCTSRGSKEDRQLGIDCGANAYLDKSNFMQKNLLELIEQLM